MNSQRAPVFITDFPNVEPDIVEPPRLHLAHHCTEYRVVELPARNVGILEHPGCVLIVQYLTLVFDERARSPPRPLTDVVVENLLVPEFEIPVEIRLPREWNCDGREFDAAQHAEFKTEPVTIHNDCGLQIEDCGIDMG